MTHNTPRQDIPQLATARLRLRPLTPHDAGDVFAYAADPEVARYTLWSAHTTAEDSHRFIVSITGGSLACWAMVPLEHGSVLGTGFTQYGLNRIEGTRMLGNVASARVMEKVDMRYEGILRQYVWVKNTFHDMRLYAILRQDVG